ncbi:fructosamine kinase family protein [Halobacillus litoralis]|uniref:fructosamine kinase family protein n=1 Tax=Halobacillus litoralis TaxID=45668 RepID=UPI001CD44A7E|nr:fructosamine kinase family protein [Halobacillus litoralis]MCA1020854.1 fructosamine kinase family protein [Halobacillus litoralis]
MEIIKKTLSRIGDDSEVQKQSAISGGDINQAFYVQTQRQEYFMKTNAGVPSHFFQVEAEGLQAIQQTGTIRVPEVYHYDQPEDGEPAALLMEWIHSGSMNDHAALGSQLAHMHSHTNASYGYGTPTFVGQLDQPNTWVPSWVDYYRTCRLGAQLDIGISKNRLTSKRRSRLEALMDKLDQYLPAHPKASLLHGDLWAGNYMMDEQGRPVLIDPSILYGDHAFELAFTEVFGGFPSDFYEHYQEFLPLPDHYEETKALYQLFYLLAHLNMFGESYGPPVDRILKHYTG